MGKTTDNSAYEEALRRIAEAKANGDTHLDLSGLGLTALPPEIGSLTALQSLDLRSNQLTALPPEIGSLTALQTLYLGGNQLTALPPEIGSLTALQSLDLRSNQLTALPPEIGSLKALQELFLHGNPALGLPPEVLGPELQECKDWGGSKDPARPADILAYYFSLRKAQRTRKAKPLNEAKVLFLGAPKAGKSSLIHALCRGVPTPDLPQTDGIVREELKRKVKAGQIVSRGGEEFRLNLWDFGGQEIYKATHKFFLTLRAIYVLVTDAREDTKLDDDLEEWLETVRIFGGGAPVWIVINKHDENPTGGPSEDALLRKYSPMLRGFIRTQCQHAKKGADKGHGAGLGIDELRRELFAAAWELEGSRQEMTPESLKLKQKLEGLEKPTLPIEEYRKLCARLKVAGAPLQDKLLDVWDKLGTVRYFPESDDDAPSMKETAILNPDWVTSAVYRIIGDPTLKERHGLVTPADIDRILKALKHPSGSHDLICNVMRRFDPVYDSGDGKMFIPLLLEDREPPLDWPTDALRFVYKYPVLPAGLISSFIAKMHKHHDPSVEPWQKGCVLKLQDCRVRVIADKTRRQIEISVVDGRPDQRRDALDQTRYRFEDLHSVFAGETIQELIPVPGYPDAPLLNYRFFRTLERKGISEQEVPIDKEFSDTTSIPVALVLGSVRGEARIERERLQDGVGAGKERVVVDVKVENNNTHVGGDATGNAFGKRSRVHNRK